MIGRLPIETSGMLNTHPGCSGKPPVGTNLPIENISTEVTMIRKHYSLQVADAVLAVLAVKEDERSFMIESYQNGREQGYGICDDAISFTEKAFKYAYVAQDRRSDRIVIYVSTSGCSQSIDDETYKTARYFDDGDYDGAADYILQTLGRSSKI
jgi:hypothetical protein